MRILIDLQSAQSGSRYRGIGRHSTAIAKAIIRNRGDHDIFLLLNGLFPDTIDQISDDFSPILPPERIVTFAAPPPVEAIIAANDWRREAAELIRESMINDIAPDVLLVSSLFEENCITSIGRFDMSTKVAVFLYDLIPFLDPEPYLQDVEAMKWYYSKIASIRRADLLLPISESARHEALDALAFDPHRAVTIYSAADECFTPSRISLEEAIFFLDRFGIRRKFVMHVSAFDSQNNFQGLIRAYRLLPKPLREDHQLVLVGGNRPDVQASYRRIADDVGLDPADLVFPGFLSDSDLVALYSLCTLFVFPSFHEGFGLPALGHKLIKGVPCGIEM
jgi:glycosyltransferase involved in cell wall biosynthesis